MGKINKELFEEIFENGRLEVKFKPRHMMRNDPCVHEDKKKEKDRRKCRKAKKKFFDEE